MTVGYSKGEMVYFSRKLKQAVRAVVQKGMYEVYVVRLKVGACDEKQLKESVDMMFLAWRMINVKRRAGMMKKYAGILRRCLIEYDSESGLYTPELYLICLKKSLVAADEYKSWLRVHVEWLSAWCTALGFYAEDITPLVLGITSEDLLMNALAHFFSEKKYSFYSDLQEKQLCLIKTCMGLHKVVAFSGVFKQAMNRHVTVER